MLSVNLPINPLCTLHCVPVSSPKTITKMRIVKPVVDESRKIVLGKRRKIILVLAVLIVIQLLLVSEIPQMLK